MRTTLRSLCILRILCRAKNPVGESFVHSGLYLLQEALGEDLDCNFYLDLHGPRSREALDSLITLEQEGKVIIAGSPRGLTVAVTESGKRFINQGGTWGVLFGVPPVRVPESQIGFVFDIMGGDDPLDMEDLGTALFFGLSVEGPGSLLERLRKAKTEGKLAEGVLERSIVEAYRRLKRRGLRLINREATSST
jgi:hypothetical protein